MNPYALVLQRLFSLVTHIHWSLVLEVHSKDTHLFDCRLFGPHVSDKSTTMRFIPSDRYPTIRGGTLREFEADFPFGIF